MTMKRRSWLVVGGGVLVCVVWLVVLWPPTFR